MTEKIIDRVQRIQAAHPWLLEDEARHLLVGAYAAMTNAYGYTGDQLQSSMDTFVDTVCYEKRSRLVKLLRDTGGLGA